MTDKCRLTIALFAEDGPAFDSLALRNGELDEPGCLLHPASGVRPNEAKEVQPARQMPPLEATVAS